MKSILGARKVLFIGLALALGQIACNLGGQPSSPGAQPTPSSLPQAALSTPSVTPQAIQSTPTSVSQVTQSTPTSLPLTTQSPAVTPAEHGTPDEAKAMLQKALDHYNTAGRKQALADFNARLAPFFDRDLYVVCLNSSHIETANGGFPQYVGTSADLVLDDSGKPVGKATWDKASATAVNSINYHWINPVTGSTEPKTLYFQKVGAEVCGVGVYSQ